MPEAPNAALFDRIQKRAMEIVEFHLIAHNELGMSSGIHAAIEELISRPGQH